MEKIIVKGVEIEFGPNVQIQMEMDAEGNITIKAEQKPFTVTYPNWYPSWSNPYVFGAQNALGASQQVERYLGNIQSYNVGQGNT